MGSTGPPAGQSQHFKQNFDGKHKHLCENFTWLKTCRKDKLCPHFHHPEHCPYAWYICINEWHGFSSKDNYDIEKAYCDLAPQADFDLAPQAYFDLPPQAYFDLAPQADFDLAPQADFQATLQFTLEEKFVAGQKKYYFERDRFRYSIHFGKMIQLNLDTGTQREVLRRPVQHTSHNLKMAPEMSPYLMQSLPKPPEHAVPAHWSKLDCYQDFELVELKNSVNEYKKVAEQFYVTMNVTQQKIVHIFRVQNPGLWDRFCSTKRLMSSRSKNSQGVDERQLFHGTPDLSGVRGICANNFDFRRAGEYVGATYGKGAYFSTSAYYSHGYTGKGSDHYMFVAKVLVGKFALGESCYSRPPQLQGLTMYDSCVNDISSPSIFVIFDLSQSYPEYLIQYGRIAAIPSLSFQYYIRDQPQQ